MLLQVTPRNTSEAMRINLTFLGNAICINEASCQAEGRVYYGDDGAGEFLLVEYQLLNASLTLDNVRKVHQLACGTPTRKQATVIEAFELLGGSHFPINQDLCNIPSDQFTIKLTPTTGDIGSLA